MKPRHIGRLWAAIAIGVLVGWLFHRDEEATVKLGRKAFVAEETARFDREFTKVDPVSEDLTLMAFTACALFGTYELLAFGFTAGVKLFHRAEDRTIQEADPRCTAD